MNKVLFIFLFLLVEIILLLVSVFTVLYFEQSPVPDYLNNRIICLKECYN